MSQCIVCLYCRCDKDIKVSYTVYNRLSVLLKSLLAITRVTPAYKLSRKQGHDYVILYRWEDSLLNSWLSFITPALICLFIRSGKYVLVLILNAVKVCFIQLMTSVFASLISRIYFGEVQLSGLGEGNCKLSFLNHWKQDSGLKAPHFRILL